MRTEKKISPILNSSVQLTQLKHVVYGFSVCSVFVVVVHLI